MFPQFDVPTVRCFDKCRNIKPKSNLFIFRVDVPTVRCFDKSMFRHFRCRNSDPNFFLNLGSMFRQVNNSTKNIEISTCRNIEPKFNFFKFRVAVPTGQCFDKKLFCLNFMFVGRFLVHQYLMWITGSKFEVIVLTRKCFWKILTRYLGVLIIFF